MKKSSIAITSILLITIGYFALSSISFPEKGIGESNTRLERMKQRNEYFFNKLKDPQTNQIPSNIRSQELKFSQVILRQSRNKRINNAVNYEYNEIGPANVGGRTRAIALDSRNSSIILAGGVSGGIWKSTNSGKSWTAKLPAGAHMGITSIAQDAVNADIWYATTGEISEGGSASGKGSGYNPFLGAGIYKSIDNGENWTLSSYSFTSNEFDQVETDDITNEQIASGLTNPFILTSKVITHDFDGNSAVFVATQYSGLWVSTDGGSTFSKFAAALVNDEDPTYCDIVIDQNDVITVWFGPTDSANNGFYRSYDSGETFFDVTSDQYPAMGDDARNVLAFAPSNPAIVYSFLYDGTNWDGSSHLFKYDFTTLDGGGSSFDVEDRSENLPTYGQSIFGGSEDFTTQGGYDMTLAVHPTDENFVVLGYVNLIRSEDGFETDLLSDPKFSWIGGNDNPWLLTEQISFDGLHHADQHIVLFDPNAPNTLYSGHDGGISKTAGIKDSRITWENLNNDYNVTQYYTISAGIYDGDSYVLGGTQDNGTPALDHSIFDGALLNSELDISSGDGAFCYAGKTIAYASAQNGSLVPMDLESGNPSRYVYGFISRDDLNTLFIHPFAVDPNDEGTLFYGSNGDGILARNTEFDEAIAASDYSIAEDGWFDFDLGVNLQITALKVTEKNPSHKLYFGGSVDGSPFLASMENANTSDDANDIIELDVSMVPDGAWLSDIAVNPFNGEEIILVYSNYNITGLYYSSDGGDSFSAIEGNLGENDDSDTGYSGPSLRAAEIVQNTDGDKKFIVGTSIGLFSTSTLNGMNTTWTSETSMLDNLVIEDLYLRADDGVLAVGTHGRGAFLGELSGSSTNNSPSVEDQTFTANEDISISTVIDTVVASDVDGDDITFAITGSTFGIFHLDEKSGELSITNELDFETTSNYEIEISVTDNKNAVTEAKITVNVLDVNEAPDITDLTVRIDENASLGTEVITMQATDPENDAISFSIISGNTGTAFAIDENTGTITVAAELDYETIKNYELEVAASDAGSSNSASILIYINNIKETVTKVIPEDLEVYPNPVTDYLTINWSDFQGAQLSDLMGKKMIEYSGKKMLNLSGFKSGFYVLTIKDNKGRTVKHKVFKK